MGAGHEQAVVALTASPDAKWIASGSKDLSIILWDAEHPEWIAAEWEGCATSSQSFAFSPDSRRLAFPALATVNTIHVGEVRPLGSLLAVLLMPHIPGSFNFSQHCAWSSDGAKLSAVAFDVQPSGQIVACVWDAKTYALLHTIEENPFINVQPNSNLPSRLINCFLDSDDLRLVLVWLPPDLLKDRDVLSCQTPKYTYPSPVYELWDIATGTRSAMITEECILRYPCSITPIPNEPLFTTACGANIWFWQVTEYYGFPWPYARNQRTFAYSPHTRQRLSWSNSWFKMWDASTDRCMSTFRCPNIVCGCFSPDGQYVAVCSVNGREGLVQVGMPASDGVLLASWRYECGPPDPDVPKDGALAFSADGRTVYFGTSSSRIYFWAFSCPSARHGQPNTTQDDSAIMRWEKWGED